MSNKKEKVGSRRIIPLTGDQDETRKLRNLQDGKCTEGGCEQAPAFKLLERSADGWDIMDFLCPLHAEEWSCRYGIDRS